MNSDDKQPPLTDSIERRGMKMNIGREDLVKIREGKVRQIVGEVIPPIQKDGNTFTFVVLPVKVDQNLKLQQMGRGIVLCQNEAQARETAKNLNDEILRQQPEPAAPCDVLESVEIIRGHEIVVDIIPLPSLPQAAGQSGSVEEIPPDREFLDIGHAHWKQPDGTVNAGLTTIREHTSFVESYRLCKYHQPYPSDGKLWPYGVERIRNAENGTEIEVEYGNRWLFATEIEAHQNFEERKTGIHKEREKLLNRPQKTQQELLEDRQLEQIQAYIDRAGDQQTKAAHQRQKQVILDARRDRENELGQARCVRERSEAETAHAREILFAELFPDLHKVKAQRERSPPADLHQWKEKMRRALKIDCRRLKIPSPFNEFIVTDELVHRLNAARKAKSPARAEDIEVVLNWVAKGYANMKQSEVAKRVSPQPVDPKNFGKRLTRKFRLRSKLKGRPETQVGQ
jgi:hypothetical protein